MLLQSSSRNKNKSHFKNVNCAVGLAGAPEYELDPSREENLQPSYTKHEVTKPAFPRFTESLCRILPVQFPSKLPESPVSGIIMNQIHCIPLSWVWDSLRHGGDTLELALDRSPRAARTINAPAALETPHRRQLSSASARVVRCLPWCAQHMNATALKILKGSSRQ